MNHKLKPIHCKYCNDLFTPRNINGKACQKIECQKKRQADNNQKWRTNKGRRQICCICGCAFRTTSSARTHCYKPECEAEYASRDEMVNLRKKMEEQASLKIQHEMEILHSHGLTVECEYEDAYNVLCK